MKGWRRANVRVLHDGDLHGALLHGVDRVAGVEHLCVGQGGGAG